MEHHSSLDSIDSLPVRIEDFTMATDAVAPPTAEGVESKDEKMSPEEKDKKTKEFVEYMRNAPGMAKIKPEFLDVFYKPKLVIQRQEEEKKRKEGGATNEAEEGGPPPAKKMKTKGRNKQRPKDRRIPDAFRLCPQIIKEEECRYGEKCRFSHDVAKYMAEKIPDSGKTCYIYETFGKCHFGLACRYGGQHISSDFKNIVDTERLKSHKSATTNDISKDMQLKLRKRQYDFSKPDKIRNEVLEEIKNKRSVSQETNSVSAEKNGEATVSDETKPVDTSSNSTVENDLQEVKVHRSGAVTDEDTIKLRPLEKKKVDFRDKLYLAPLTTVGNLPFRRICKQYKADITCGEMAMATNLLQGQQSEWALLKRHETEDIFGVQICGAFPDSMSRCAQLLADHTNADFVDINCGCPIDLVFNKGEGSALMKRVERFEQIVRCMSSVLPVPLTVKMRTGIYDDRKVAHSLIPKIKDWGVALMTLHGRTRQQRYTNLADWNYINECAKVADPIPLFGNGDIMSFEDANLHKAETDVAGLMIARGALIKPWVFTEIKEQRHWDISSSERFDMLKDFTNYGLEHWGSDHQGVESTRRFLLEWLSFLHRYIPVGLLERLPQKINERPPYFFGRNDLETLMTSSNCDDWVKISEMLLGPVPDTFRFLPKHKANSYKQTDTS